MDTCTLYFCLTTIFQLMNTEKRFSDISELALIRECDLADHTMQRHSHPSAVTFVKYLTNENLNLECYRGVRGQTHAKLTDNASKYMFESVPVDL